MNMDILSKDNSKVLRGIAIITIALHNYLHILGFSTENEMSFSMENTRHFFDVVSWENSLAEIFSFLGWMGFPVFIFLTGYGVAHTPPSYMEVNQ